MPNMPKHYLVATPYLFSLLSLHVSVFKK